MATKDWIQSRSGHKVSIRAPAASAFVLDDIAHGLACKNRFAGQTFFPYSVAEHCVRGATELLAVGFRYDLALAFLLHEGGEVFLPDVASPLKPWVAVNLAPVGKPQGLCRREWHVLEERHEDAMLYALDLDHLKPLIHSPIVRKMDLDMLAWEKRDLMAPEPEPWWEPGKEPVPPSSERIRSWGWKKAKRMWRTLFKSLVRKVEK